MKNFYVFLMYYALCVMQQFIFKSILKFAIYICIQVRGACRRVDSIIAIRVIARCLFLICGI